jgi:hypothetical protein
MAGALAKKAAKSTTPLIVLFCLSPWVYRATVQLASDTSHAPSRDFLARDHPHSSAPAISTNQPRDNERIRRHVKWARDLAGWIQEDPQFELAAPVTLGLVCFRHRGGEAPNQQIIDTLNASGKLCLTHTRLEGKLTLRFSIGQTNTQRRHVERAWQLM